MGPIVTAVPELRPMRADDVPAAHELAIAAFADLERRMHAPESPLPQPEAAYLRLRRILATDPGGCWVAEDGAGLTGAGLALRRDGVWGLSLLVVRPDLQSAGIGSALLSRTLAYGADARGWVILASPDPRALRAYARAGFALHPAVMATGAPRAAIGCADVRPFEPADHELAAEVDRVVRGAPHGADLEALAAGGCELLTLPGRGYAAHREGAVKTIAAFDEEAAGALLRTVLARIPKQGRAEVEWMTSAQQWAIEVAVAARLELRPAGAVCLRGDVGSFRPYLPGGAYL
jgi:GNAT superfamily N-acetyltransferase